MTIGSAIQFDGTTSSYGVVRLGGIDRNDAMSIECWTKTVTWKNPFGVIIFKGTSDGLQNYGFFTMSGTTESPGNQFNIRTSAGECILGHWTGSFSYQSGSWYHWVGTYQSGTSVSNHMLYFNGSLVGSRTPMGPPTTNNGSLWFGTEFLTYTREANAIMDEVRIWNKVLTAGSIATLFNGGAGLYCGSQTGLAFGAHIDVSGTNNIDYSSGGAIITFY